MEYVLMFLSAQLLTLIIFLTLCMVGRSGDDND